MWYVDPRIAAPLHVQGLTWHGVDDILEYYGKSLEIHKGCDILDINPGAGLWSQKLHNFLQPRRHVLMEPEPERFEAFLDPLLDAPDSKYTLVKKDTTIMSSYREVIEEGAFPEQTRVNPDDTSEQKLNTTLLVTGMLVWDPKRPGMAFDSMAKQLYNHFAQAVRGHDLFHAYGRVRTLFWVSSEDFKQILPSAATHYHKNNCFLELTYDIEHVVDGPRTERGLGRNGPGREVQYEIESIVKAFQRGREKGMVLPDHRKDKIHRIAEEIEEMTNGTGQVKGATWLHDFLVQKHIDGDTPTGMVSNAYLDHVNNGKVLQEKYPDLNLSQIGNAREDLKRKVHNFWTSYPNHPGRNEVVAFSVEKAADRAHVKNKEKLEAIAEIGMNIWRKERQVLQLPDGPEKETLLKELEVLNEEWEKSTQRLPTNYKAAPVSIADDRISLRTPPHPRFQQDRRSFEPLTMHPDEAWPPTRLSLISSTPFPRPADQDPQYFEWVQDFVFALYNLSSASLPEALDKMQHGASQIIDDCPSLRDPERGGRLDLRHLRVRMLTKEQIEELVTAYRSWPFKEPGSDHSKYFRFKGGRVGAGLSMV